MPFNPDTHHRQSIRLPDFDYASPGAYFVTIVTKHRERVFGPISDGEIQQNDAGIMVDYWWHEIQRHFLGTMTDTFVVMPNHIHGIIHLDVGADRRVRPGNTTTDQTPGRTHRCAPTLGTIVQWFKTMTTNMYIQGVRHKQWSAFPGRLWQRNYHERIIRTEQELNSTRQYIADNPRLWETDEEYVR